MLPAKSTASVQSTSTDESHNNHLQNQAMNQNENNNANNNNTTPADPYYLMSKMIHDVRLFQAALADLVHVLADTNLARQKSLVNLYLTNMLKPTRAVITNYDLAENLQHCIINGTSSVISSVKTYNAAWEEVLLKNKKLKAGQMENVEKEILSAKYSTDSSGGGKDSKTGTPRGSTASGLSDQSKDTAEFAGLIGENESTKPNSMVIESAVIAAIAAGLNENGEFDLTKTPLHEQLFNTIDELALTFSNAVATHLTSLQPVVSNSQNSSDNSPALLATHNVELTTTQQEFDTHSNPSTLDDQDYHSHSKSSGERGGKSPKLRHKESVIERNQSNRKYVQKKESTSVHSQNLSSTDQLMEKDNSNNNDNTITRQKLQHHQSNNSKTSLTHIPLSRQSALRNKSSSIESSNKDASQNNNIKQPVGITSSQPSNTISSRYTSKSPPLQLQGLDSTESHAVDKLLAKNKFGVDKAMEHLKRVVKYSNLVIFYIEARTKSLSDYGKSLQRNSGKISSSFKGVIEIFK